MGFVYVNPLETIDYVTLIEINEGSWRNCAVVGIINRLRLDCRQSEIEICAQCVRNRCLELKLKLTLQARQYQQSFCLCFLLSYSVKFKLH